MEKVGEVEVVEGREVTSLWWESRIVFLWALAQLGAEALPCKINFRFKQPRPKVNGGKAILPQTSKKSSRVFLTEEQIFSFDWKVEKLYRDTSDEKALCRHLTAFIKGVRCADMNVTERGLVVSFHCLNDLEEALAKFCTSVSNTLEKLEKRQRAFTLLPSHGREILIVKSCIFFFRVLWSLQCSQGEPSPLLQVHQVSAQDLLSLVPNKAFFGEGTEGSLHPADLPCSLDRLPQHLHLAQERGEVTGCLETSASASESWFELQHHLPSVGSAA